MQVIQRHYSAAAGMDGIYVHNRYMFLGWRRMHNSHRGPLHFHSYGWVGNLGTDMIITQALPIHVKNHSCHQLSEMTQQHEIVWQKPQSTAWTQMHYYNLDRWVTFSPLLCDSGSFPIPVCHCSSPWRLAQCACPPDSTLHSLPQTLPENGRHPTAPLGGRLYWLPLRFQSQNTATNDPAIRILMVLRPPI